MVPLPDRPPSLRLLLASSFVDGYNLIVIAPFLLLYGASVGTLPTWLVAVLSISAILGNLVGGLLLGHLGDLFGRRRVFLWDVGFFVVMPLLSAVAPSLLLLAAFRFLLGVGIGGNYPLASVLLSETSPASSRGSRVALLGLSWTAGALTSYALGALLFPLGSLALPILFLAVVPPAVVVVVLRQRLSESGEWHRQMSGRTLRERMSRASVGRLAESGIRKGTTYAAGFWFLFDIVQYGVSLFLPLLLVAFGHLHGRSALMVSALLYSGELLGTLVGIRLVDVVGRRTLQLTGFAAMAAGLLLAAAFPLSSALLLLLLLFLVTTGVGVGPGIMEFVYPPELFPTEIRATGSGFALTMSRLGAFIGILVVPVLFATVVDSTRYLFLLYGAIAVGAFLLTWSLAPETRGLPLTGADA